MRIAACLAVVAVVAGALVVAAGATPPADVRIVAGAMPGFPHALPQRYGRHPLTAAQRRTFTLRFSRIGIGALAAPAVARMGRIHKLLVYTAAGNRCNYFDGGFVLCLVGPRVVAKGYETTY